MLKLDEPEIEMDGGEIVKVNAVLEVTFPEVPVMVKTDVPKGTVLLEERVK